MFGQRRTSNWKGTGDIGNRSGGKRKRGFGGGNGFRKRSRTNAGRVALREVKSLKRELNKNIIVKRYTTLFASSNLVSGTALTHTVNTMAGASDDIEKRSGPQISMSSLAYRLKVHIHDAETSPCLVRVCLVYDRRHDGSATASPYNSIFTDNYPTALIENDDLAERGRYQIIHDQIFSLEPGGQAMAFEKGYINLKGKKTIYSGNDVSDLEDVEMGLLSWYVISRDNPENISFRIESRLNFLDAGN